MTSRQSRPPAHFEQLYRNSPDPWNLATSDYERRKYAATLKALGGRHFQSAFEAGCSIGVLTEALARHCGALLAGDFIETALAAAHRRCAHLPHVRIERMHLPQDWPAQKFDLIVLSEILYFLSPQALARLAARATASLHPNALVLLVNYTGPTGDPLTGHEAATRFITATAPTLTPTLHQTNPNYRLDLLQAGGLIATG